MADIAEIFEYTTHQWGIEQAERYASLLHDAANKAAIRTIPVQQLKGKSHIQLAFVRWPESLYGHFLVFRETEIGIYVLRVLHTARNVSEEVRKAMD